MPWTHLRCADDACDAWGGTFSSTRPPHGQCANTHICPCAGPFSPHSRRRDQRRDTPLWREQKEPLSLARAPQRCKKTRRLFALTPQLLPQLMEGNALYTRGHKQVAPPESHGWPVVCMDRATRVLWAMPWGRKARQRFHKALGLLCQGIQQTGDLTLLTDGEKRYGSLWFALCSQALRTGTRGRPKKP